MQIPAIGKALGASEQFLGAVGRFKEKCEFGLWARLQISSIDVRGWTATSLCNVVGSGKGSQSPRCSRVQDFASLAPGYW